jgi:hypothetical protein
VQIVGPLAALIEWSENTETDLKGYRLIRSDWKPAEARQLGIQTGYTDPNYDAGKGLTYQLFAIDRSGNESAPASVTGP